jgi:hypothetical protein
MRDTIKSILKPITSLRLTIICLSLAMVLVFIGTLAQEHMDAFYAQKKYFDSWFVWWTSGDYPEWMITWRMTWLLSWIPEGRRILVFPGGFLLGSVFLVNLIAAHTVRFKMSWKKSGIILTHLGLICMLVGGLFTALWARDSRMTIAPGETTNYTESLFKEFELAIIDKSNPDHDVVVSIPESFVAKKMPVQNSNLPFVVKPLEYFPNAELAMRQPGVLPQPGATAQIADKGMGVRLDVVPLPVTTKPEEDNYPAAFAQLETATGSLGTWLLWAAPFGSGVPSQSVTVDGKTYELQLRLKRSYKSYQIHLDKFTHEIYAGTGIPKNFASQIHLTDAPRNENREVLIYMNHPLRYHGEIFYQFQTLGADEKYSVFEVVQNPSWWLPYVSCLMVGVGLIIQFGMHLVSFSKRRIAT